MPYLKTIVLLFVVLATSTGLAHSLTVSPDGASSPLAGITAFQPARPPKNLPRRSAGRTWRRQPSCGRMIDPSRARRGTIVATKFGNMRMPADEPGVDAAIPTGAAQGTRCPAAQTAAV